jgi:tetratricopeptide (TPR) repeat protein
VNPAPSSDGASRLTRFLNRDQDVALVFDDGAVPAILGFDPVNAEGTPLDAIVHWRQGIDRSVECARAVAALLVQKPSRAAELESVPELEKCWQKMIAAPAAADRMSVRNVAACLCGLATLAEARGLVAEAIHGNMRALDLYREGTGFGRVEFAAVAKRTVKLLEHAGRDLEARRLDRIVRVRRIGGRRDRYALSELRLFALEMYWEGDYAEAEVLFRRLIEYRFELANPQCHLVQVLLMANRIADAGVEIARAFQHSGPASNDVKAHLHFLQALVGAIAGHDVTPALREMEALLRIPNVTPGLDMKVLEHVRARITPAQDTLMTTLARAFSSRGHMVELEQNPDWSPIAVEAATRHAAALLPRKSALLASTENTAEFALTCNEVAVELRRGQLATDAEELFRRAIAVEDKLLPPKHPRRAHRRTHLASVLLMQGRWDEAREILTIAWGLARGTADLIAARILVYRLGLAWLSHETANVFAGQLKTLLSGPQLCMPCNIVAVWTPTEIFNVLGASLSAVQRSALLTVASVLNCAQPVSSLDQFSFWKEQVPIDLDRPWTNACGAAVSQV